MEALRVHLDVTAGPVRAVLARRNTEPWYSTARAALEAAVAGDRSPEVYLAMRPFYYGRWDDAARDGYFAGVTFDPPATRAALLNLEAPVLLYAGGVDAFPTVTEVRESAALFPRSSVEIQPGAAHFPWVDDPASFAAAVSSFLDEHRVLRRDGRG